MSESSDTASSGWTSQKIINTIFLGVIAVGLLIVLWAKFGPEKGAAPAAPPAASAPAPVVTPPAPPPAISTKTEASAWWDGSWETFRTNPLWAGIIIAMVVVIAVFFRGIQGGGKHAPKLTGAVVVISFIIAGIAILAMMAGEDPQEALKGAAKGVISAVKPSVDTKPKADASAVAVKREVKWRQADGSIGTSPVLNQKSEEEAVRPGCKVSDMPGGFGTVYTAEFRDHQGVWHRATKGGVEMSAFVLIPLTENFAGATYSLKCP